MIQSRIGNGEILLGQKGEEKPGEGWSLSIGNALNRRKENVNLDSASPHVIFVCGARGSGKSYTLGVIAEEIARNESDIAAVLVDPIGVFWSMKYKNQEKKEIEKLKNLDMEPEGIESLSVFVPTGYKADIPRETYDDEFSFKPNALNTDDWCLTFGIDRYSPQGLLLERTLEEVRSGYTRQLGDKFEGGSRNVPPKEDFSINDLLECMNHDEEILSKDRGFRGSTRRALTSRLTAAKDWGIFGSSKRLSDLIRPGQISVIDISFLSENIGSLVLGILARKILSARKAAARKEAVQDLRGEKETGSGSIPPTWLMVDEAHSFAPSTGKTAATNPLVEYVKQGRRPGLSAVLSTQQPSALNSKIISQLDILISHRLSFENDIKEVRKRIPTSLPGDLKEPESLKRLSEGRAIVSDRQTNRAFVISVRPRYSQHEGRERVTKELSEEPSAPAIKEPKEQPAEPTVQTKDYTKKEEEALIVPALIEMDEALDFFESERERLFNFFWTSEKVREIIKRYYPIWSVLIDYYPKDRRAMNLRVFIDGLTGELIKKKDSALERTNGIRSLVDLKPSEMKIFFEVLRKGPVSLRALKESFKKRNRINSSVEELIENGLIEENKTGKKITLCVKEALDVPTDLSDKALLAAEDTPDREPEMIPTEEKIERMIDEEQMLESLEIFGKVELIERELFYYPYWLGKITDKEKTRIIALDGVLGKKDVHAERMLRRRVK